MEAPKTKDWAAWIDLRNPSAPTLHVTGQVQTNAGYMLPVLREADAQGPNSTILLLDLTIENSGNRGTEEIGFRDARFDKPASKGQYARVHILYGSDIIEKIDVTETN